ncbi:dienelactone hydrolase family protein [Thioalkalivibrio sp. HK1]|uniref:dienelactone hydrolase family protein n=1 Tax=Thioalkalivibrio sp. HK1 TaxID=1469245 RepID=UPI00047221D0|nr:dienelactone hydrolase family protein [Thioalkalivibrio sp. HK1]
MTRLRTEDVNYSADEIRCQGHFAFDESIDGPRPGVMVVHEWWGLNDYIRGRAQMLAELGYVALAVDMYGEGRTAADPENAGAMMKAVLDDMQSGTARLKAARQTLANHPRCDSSRLSAIGYCFGGAMVLHCARIGMDLQAVASFHGALGSFHRPSPGGIRAKILVCHGAEDTLVSSDDLAAFTEEMRAADADFRIITYDDAMHGFTNPQATANGEKYSMPLAYHADADRASWQALLAHLEGAAA